MNVDDVCTRTMTLYTGPEYIPSHCIHVPYLLFSANIRRKKPFYKFSLCQWMNVDGMCAWAMSFWAKVLYVARQRNTCTNVFAAPVYTRADVVREA